MTNDESGDGSWPKSLSEAAFHGLAGEFVRMIEPHTEADPAALLVQFLLSIGCMAGRNPHQSVEADRHGVNLFAAVVGKSSKARKGSSLGYIKRHLRAVDPSLRVQSGLSSGEGLIHNLRDREHGDPLEVDKRLLIVEPELASVLRVAVRSGNTMSAVIRDTWDGGTIQVMTKNRPETASNSHVSLIGHITAEELRKELTSTDSSNGFANRFLWVCAQRSQSLPEGGRVPEVQFADFESRSKQVIDKIRKMPELELRRNEEARKYWNSIYDELSADKAGKYGPTVSRAEAQVMRMSSIYALLDESTAITIHHLRAAEAVWRYCEASARHIFGGSPLHSDEAKILVAVRESPQGLSRTEISQLFNRNRSAEVISAKLSYLEGKGSIKPNKTTTGGRPEERWFVVEGLAPSDEDA